MPRTRPPYPPEFRREAVRLARESGKPSAQIAQDLGISYVCDESASIACRLWDHSVPCMVSLWTLTNGRQRGPPVYTASEANVLLDTKVVH